MGTRSVSLVVFLATLLVWHNLAVPPYLSLLFYICLTLWAWSGNLHLLNLAGIDTAAVLQKEAFGKNADLDCDEPGGKGQRPASHAGLVSRLYSLSTAFSTVCMLFATAYSAFSEQVGDDGVEWAVLTVYALLLAWFLLPSISALWGRERAILRRMLWRSATDPLYSSVPLSDVILCDILT